jgi:RNA-directed DNA polymerase
MMNGPEKSDSVIVALKPTNKAERSAAELVEQRTGTKGNVGQLSTCRAQNRISVTQVLARVRQQLPSTLGGRSYGAGGGGHGIFIVHSN